VRLLIAVFRTGIIKEGMPLQAHECANLFAQCGINFIAASFELSIVLSIPGYTVLVSNPETFGYIAVEYSCKKNVQVNENQYGLN
jgi:hypothetical protein